VLVFATASFGVASVLSAMSGSLDELMIWRFVTAVGVGGPMPSAITLTSEYCPAQPVLASRGDVLRVHPGGAHGGLSSAVLIADFGWQGILMLGGALP
jgi:AAHS family 4-hydroxybenzoate transporter-like MFS transporter